MLIFDWKNLESIFFGRKRKTFRENFFLIPFFIFIIVEKIRTDLETMENERFQNFSNFHFYPSLSIFLNDLDDNARSLDDNFPRIFIVFARVSSFPSPLPPLSLGTSLSSTREKWTFRFIIDSLLSRLFFYLGVIFFFRATHHSRGKQTIAEPEPR